MPPAPLHVLPSADAVGEHVAGRVLDALDGAAAAGRALLLGCPTGRTPRPTFAALARRLAEAPRDLGRLVLVLMDEYVVPNDDGGFAYAAVDAPWSCHHFARAEIVAPLNAAVPMGQGIREENVWFPDPRDPAAYEVRIADAGGIDLFLLASGASDGHVAFNPPGTARESRTRIIPLSDETRRDNVQTFPAFGSLDAVPHHGVSVGIATIADARAALMLVTGAGKRRTLARIRAAAGYEADWSATVIHACPAGEVVCDVEAAGAAG